MSIFNISNWIFQSWSILHPDKNQVMVLNLLNLLSFFLLILPHLSLSTSFNCSKDEEYNAKRSAKMCFNKMLTKLGVETSCDGFDFRNSYCDKRLEKCFESNFRMEMRDFFLEKAINLKQWIFLAKKLLDNTRAKSVFYFFSPFLIHFCSGHQLKWFHILNEECMHVKTVIRAWPANKMEFMKCPSVKEYLSSGRKRVFGPVLSCTRHLNHDYNFCVQKHMNILPAKKNSSWKDACKHLKQVINLEMSTLILI